jgi:hypothetical protein
MECESLTSVRTFKYRTASTEYAVPVKAVEVKEARELADFYLLLFMSSIFNARRNRKEYRMEVSTVTDHGSRYSTSSSVLSYPYSRT